MDITEWASYRITGVVERKFQVPDAPAMPGGTCDHCGTAIMVCIQVTHVETGEQQEIGSDCAIKVGMDAAEIKRLNRERYAARRAADREARSERARIEREARELEEAGRLGAHGTESRFTYGCRCNLCRAVAPHGTYDSFRNGCHCPNCIDAAVEAKPDNYWLSDAHPVLVDLNTGEIADAREVFVEKYATYRWCVGGGALWLATGPARRNTHAKHGYVEALAPVLLYSARISGEGHKPPQVSAVLGAPLVDIWGESTPRPAVQDTADDEDVQADEPTTEAEAEWVPVPEVRVIVVRRAKHDSPDSVLMPRPGETAEQTIIRQYGAVTFDSHLGFDTDDGGSFLYDPTYAHTP